MIDNEKGYEVNSYSMLQIRNRNELRVADAVRRILPDQKDFCGCRLCVEDVYAAALNSIPSQYIQQGSIALSKQPAAAELDASVQEAFARVDEHPKHRKEP